MRSRLFFNVAAIAFLPLITLSSMQAQGLSARAASRILDQATWGPTPGSAGILELTGFDAWFAQQVAAPVSTYSDQPLENSAGNANTNLAPVQLQFFQNAMNGPDQLRQRVAFALSEIWVISELEVVNAQAFPPLMRIFESRAFDNYENLMYDVTLNPGMGKFLNMANNNAGSAASNTSPNENYAREVMQLFTLGLTQLNIDGTPHSNSEGAAVPNYSQVDVDNMAKVFTGWTYPPLPGTVTRGHNPAYYIGAMVPVAAYHDVTQKEILGVTLPAGQTAQEDLTAALHTIFMQSSLPPFVSQQLIEHLVTSNPSPAYVGRVAKVFENNGSGVRGDLKAVIYAILTDPEARADDAPSVTVSANFGHMREPVLFVINLLRGLSGTLSATSTAFNAATTLGQNLFFAPSVFSYFSPEYRTTGGLVGPEFQIYSTQTAVNRANVVNSLVYGGQLDAGTKVNLAPYITAASTPAALITLINNTFFHGAMSSSLQSAITASMAPLTAASDKAKAALYIALTSSEYQIIH